MPQMNDADERREQGQGQVGPLDRAGGVGHAEPQSSRRSGRASGARTAGLPGAYSSPETEPRRPQRAGSDARPDGDRPMNENLAKGRVPRVLRAAAGVHRGQGRRGPDPHQLHRRRGAAQLRLRHQGHRCADRVLQGLHRRARLHQAHLDRQVHRGQRLGLLRGHGRDRRRHRPGHRRLRHARRQDLAPVPGPAQLHAQPARRRVTRGSDVVVVGGGIVGVAAAAFLAEAGATVTLVERDGLASGASGANSGIVQHPFDPVLAALYRETSACIAS